MKKSIVLALAVAFLAATSGLVMAQDAAASAPPKTHKTHKAKTHKTQEEGCRVDQHHERPGRRQYCSRRQVILGFLTRVRLKSGPFLISRPENLTFLF